MVQGGRRVTPRRTVQRGARLAEELRSRREAAELSRDALCRRVGISGETLRKIESHATHDPGFFTVVDLADALGLDLVQLVARTREPALSGPGGAG